jgi:hypothetical protein
VDIQQTWGKEESVIFVGKYGGKRQLGTPRCKWADNTKMDNIVCSNSNSNSLFLP